MRVKQDNPNLRHTATIIGRIHKFGSYYMLSGIYKVRVPNPFILEPVVMMDMYEEDQIRESENIPLSPKTISTTVYNKYPSNWVNGICKALSISTRGKKATRQNRLHLCSMNPCPIS